MADSTKDDVHILNLAPAIIALIPGLMIHLFIIGTNLTEWSKGRLLTPVDRIITFLGVSMMGMQCADILYFIVAAPLLRSLDSHIIQNFVNAVYFFFNYTNIWLTTLLLIVFCLKISNLRTRLFLYLRRVILPRTGHFIVASGLLSAVNSLLSLWTDMINGGTYNDTVGNHVTVCIYVNSIINFTLGTSIPLFFYFISSILLFASLYHHTLKMKKSSSLSVSLETYYSAMKFVSFTFLYNATYFIGHWLCAFFYYFSNINPTWPYIFLDFLPVLHSSYLIYRTAKLRSQMSNVLQNLKEFLFQSKDAETRDNID